jgi:hypothetical protein
VRRDWSEIIPFSTWDNCLTKFLCAEEGFAMEGYTFLPLSRLRGSSQIFTLRILWVSQR